MHIIYYERCTSFLFKEFYILICWAQASGARRMNLYCKYTEKLLDIGLNYGYNYKEKRGKHIGLPQRGRIYIRP